MPCARHGRRPDRRRCCCRPPAGGYFEATTTGLHRLEGLEIPFPVLDWNGIALKDLIHNRHHVGVETWPAFGHHGSGVVWA